MEWINLSTARALLNVSEEDLLRLAEQHQVRTSHAVLDGRRETLLSRDDVEKLAPQSATGETALARVSVEGGAERLSAAFSKLADAVRLVQEQGAAQQELLDIISKRLQLENSEKVQSLEVLRQFRDAVSSADRTAALQTAQLQHMQAELVGVRRETHRRIVWATVVTACAAILICTAAFLLFIEKRLRVAEDSLGRSASSLNTELDSRKATLDAQLVAIKQEIERQQTVLAETRRDLEQEKVRLQSVIETGSRLLNDDLARVSTEHRQFYEKRVAELEQRLKDETSVRETSEMLLKGLEAKMDQMSRQVEEMRKPAAAPEVDSTALPATPAPTPDTPVPVTPSPDIPIRDEDLIPLAPPYTAK